MRRRDFLGAVGNGAIGPEVGGLRALGRAARPWPTGMHRTLIGAHNHRSSRDETSCVRVAAARALGPIGAPVKALPILADELHNGNEVVRHYAALAPEDLGEAARPAMKALHQATRDKYDLVPRVAIRIVTTLGK